MHQPREPQFFVALGRGVLQGFGALRIQDLGRDVRRGRIFRRRAGRAVRELEALTKLRECPRKHDFRLEDK